MLAPAMVRLLRARWLSGPHNTTAVIALITLLDVANTKVIGALVFVSRQLGHADASVTLSVYAHLFARAKHAPAARSAIEASYAAMTPSPEPARLSLLSSRS